MRRILPDNSIFITTEYQVDILSSRLRELAFLNKGIRLILEDKRQVDENGIAKSKEFYSEHGLKEFVEYLDQGREKLTENIIHISTEKMMYL